MSESGRNVVILDSSTHRGTVTIRSSEESSGSVRIYSSGHGAGDDELARRYAERAETAAEAAKEDRDDAEAWAVGQRRGVDVEDTDDTYQNNSKWYAEQAAEAAQEATDAEAGIRQTISTAGTTAVGNVNSAKNAAIQAIEQKGQDTLSNIPENYQTLQDTVDQLQEDVDEHDEVISGGLVQSVVGTQDGKGIIVTPVGEEASTIPLRGMAFDSGACELGDDEAGQDPGKYYLHLTLNGEDIDDFTPFELVGTGGGGGSTSAITLTDVVRPSEARNGQSCVFSMTATASDAEDITAIWSVNGARIGNPVVQISGTSFRFDAGSYLNESATNTVAVSFTTATGGTTTRTYTVVTAAFSISFASFMSPIMLYTEDEDVAIYVDVAAQARTTNIVTATMNGESVSAQITGSGQAVMTLEAEWFTTGANTISCVMTSGTDASDQSDTISMTAIWAYGATGPIVAFSAGSFSGTQYEAIPIHYYVYDPENETAAASRQLGSDAAVPITPGREMQTFAYLPFSDENTTITVTCGSATATAAITVEASLYNIGYVNANPAPRYIIDPAGHSNTDGDRARFANITFQNDFDWVNGGFQADDSGCPALVIKKGQRVTLPRSLFEETDTAGVTIDICYRITHSDSYDAVAMEDLDDAEQKGLIIRANEAEIRLNNATGQICRCCEDRRIDLSIHVEAVTSQRVVTFWLDGVPSKAFPYTAGTLVQDENAAVIGSDHCDIWIYAIRVYNAALSEQNMVQNYIANGATTAEKVARCIANDVYSGSTKTTSYYAHPVITQALLHIACPDLTIISIEAERMSRTKRDPVAARVSIQDGGTTLVFNKAENISSDGKKGDGAFFLVQGTSSTAYERSSLNLDFNLQCKLLSGNANPGWSYQISENSIPVSYLNFKTNVASSENANNVCAVDWYNTYQPYRIYARQQDGRVRDTVEGKPCAVFFTNTGTEAVWCGSQYVNVGETILYAIGDLCNSKKNTEVFAQDGSGEHYTKACIEVSDNNTQPERFRSSEAVYNDADGEWQTTGTDGGGNPTTIKHFEWRMEPDEGDKADVVAAWNATVAWVASTINDSEKFYNEFSNYFQTDSMLYHFLMIEMFAAYDDVCKNTFYSFDWDEDADQTIWGGYRWNIKEAYDWDTILACDNDGVPLGDYGLDYGDSANGRYYFNDEYECPIWFNIQSEYHAELSALYNTLRGQGAFNSTAILTKWDNYQAIRPHAILVRDAYAKYIYPYKTTGVMYHGDADPKGYDSNYLNRLQGSKAYQRAQFLTYQAAYMDGKYGYYNTSAGTQFRTNEAVLLDFTVKSYAKTYITFVNGSSVVGQHKVEAGSVTTFEDVQTGANTTIYVTPDNLVQYIRPLNQTRNSTFNAPGNKLMEAILGGASENEAWDAARGLTIPSPILQDLSIRNMVNFSSALDLTANTELKTLDTRGTNAGRISIAAYAPMTECHLNACTGLEMRNITKLTTAGNFSLESGDNLTHVVLENCGYAILDAMMGYLEDAFEAGGSGTKEIRITGIHGATETDRYEMSDTTLLNYLLGARGLDAGGNTTSMSVLTGKIYVPTIKSKELEAYQAAWGSGLDISYTTMTVQYPVYFWQDDYDTLTGTGTPIYDTDGNPYVQWVDATQSAYDPTTADPAEVDMTDTANLKAPDERYTYTYSQWDSLPVGVIAPENVKAVYTRAIRTYTVRWYDGVGSGNGRLLEEQTGVSYGSSVTPTDDCPSYTDMEGSNIYYVFLGWDKNTGFIRGDTVVKARWSIGNRPSTSSGKGLADMTWAERSGVAKSDLCETYWEPGENMDFELGQDLDFMTGGTASELGYVESRTLISESTWFDGTNPIIYNGENDLPSIQLFNGSIPRWTIAIDYEFTGDAGSIISCFNDNGNYGFQYRRTGTATNLLWGNVNQTTGYQYQRGMLVIRYNEGYPLILYVAGDGNTGANVYRVDSGDYTTSMITAALARTTMDSIDAPLTLGGVGYMAGSDVSGLRATGWVHWCKIWYDDLGLDNAKKLAVFPHLPVRFKYTRIQYRDGADSANTVAGGFQMEGLLPQAGVMNPTNTNAGGWDACVRRQWLNGQFFDALPVPLQSMIQEARVRATEGGGTSSVHALTIVNSMDKVYLPCYAEAFSSVTGNNTDNIAYVDECDDTGHRIPYFVTDASRGITNANYSRIRFCGFTLDDDTEYIVSASDPTTPGLGYTVTHGKTVWINTSNSSIGYLFVSAEYAAKHKQLGGRLTDHTDNKDAVGTDANENSLGKWISARFWWLRSPYVTNSTHFWNVGATGGSNGNNAYYTHGLAPAFSI